MALGTGAQVPVIPPDELERLKAIRRYDILDTPPEGSFNRIAALAADRLGTPIATITIVDHDRIWCKARQGLEVEELDREAGLCSSAILQAEPYVVLDASVDLRCLTNSLVAGEFGLKFYAAAPIVTQDGYRLGTLNVIDKHAREVTKEELKALTDLAAVVVDELELRLAARKLVEAQTQLSRLGEAFQQSALPPRFPSIAGLDLAAWYRPVGSDLLIGGDFYDLFDLRDGVWGLAVGDVCGKGADAAVIMGAVLQNFRALAEVDRLPSQLLWDLNESLMSDRTSEKFCTACYVVMRPGHGYLDLAVCAAGHPLPLLRRKGGAVEEACGTGTMLGAFHDPYLRDTNVRLEVGDALLVYTDGVIEQHRDAVGGEEQLRIAFSESPETDALSILTYLEQQTQPTTRPLDDKAMVLIKVVDRRL